MIIIWAKLVLIYTLGFQNTNLLHSHHQKHGADFGAIGLDEYETLADAFLGGPRVAACFECVRSNGDFVRYNPMTDEFGVISNTRIIKTYYKPQPSDRIKYPTNTVYFREQCRK